MKSYIILEDGAIFEGASRGKEKTGCGPVVFYTGVVGYQEAITDPANAGKIVLLTYPLIGNYGTNPLFNESARSHTAGVVIKEDSHIYSNWQAKGSFNDFLERERLACISEVDTRTLMVDIRNKKEPWALISTGSVKRKAAVKKIAQRKKEKTSYLKDVSVDKLRQINTGSPRIVIIDLGICGSFVNQLKSLGPELWLAPYNITASELLKLNPAGIIVSSGPEEDPQIDVVVKTVKEVLGKVPLLGIASGLQVIGRALGGRISKLGAGHHGLNYPVMAEDTHKGEITSQNHSYVVDEDSLKGITDVRVAERNLHDHTVEKIISEQLRMIAIQYYPASPGFGQPHPIFSDFLNMVR